MGTRRFFGLVFITVAAVLPLLSCTTSSPSDSASSPLPGEVYIEVIPPDYVIQGQPVEYTFVINNQSEHPLLLLELLPTNRDVSGVSTVSREINPVQDGAVHRWTLLAGGRFSQNPRTSEFTFTPRSRPPPRDRHLHAGLLRPGASTRIRLRMLFLTPGRFNQHFTLRFHRTSGAELRRRAYIPERPLTSSTDRSVRFINLGDRTDNQSPPPKQILIHPAYQIVVEQTLSRRVRVFEGSMSTSEAERLLSSHTSSNLDPERFRFDPLNNRWLIQTEDQQVWAVSRDQVQAVPQGLFEDVTHVASTDGPVTIYIGPRLESGRDILDPLWTRTERTNVRSFTFDRQTALDLLNSLRSDRVSIRWTRTPLTNQPAAVLNPPED